MKEAITRRQAIQKIITATTSALFLHKIHPYLPQADETSQNNPTTISINNISEETKPLIQTNQSDNSVYSRQNSSKTDANPQPKETLTTQQVVFDYWAPKILAMVRNDVVETPLPNGQVHVEFVSSPDWEKRIRVIDADDNDKNQIIAYKDDEDVPMASVVKELILLWWLSLKQKNDPNSLDALRSNPFGDAQSLDVYKMVVHSQNSATDRVLQDCARLARIDPQVAITAFNQFIVNELGLNHTKMTNWEGVGPIPSWIPINNPSRLSDLTSLNDYLSSPENRSLKATALAYLSVRDIEPTLAEKAVDAMQTTFDGTVKITGKNGTLNYKVDAQGNPISFFYIEALTVNITVNKPDGSITTKSYFVSYTAVSERAALEMLTASFQYMIDKTKAKAGIPIHLP